MSDAAPGQYRPRTPRAASLALAAGTSVAIALVLAWLDPPHLRGVRAALLTVRLLPVDRRPPKQTTLPTAKAPRPVVPQPDPVVVAPKPLVETVRPVPPVATMPTPSPAPPHIEAPEPAPPRAPAAADLGTRLLSATPPKYPVEARRRRETGTVVLHLVVGENGAVEQISIRASSGSASLDKAALDAVRRWRWSPTVIDGRASRVTGLVRIPFELKG